MKRGRRLTLLAALVAGAGLACSQTPTHDGWAADVAARHRDADRLLDAGDAVGARAALLPLVNEPPRGPRAAPARHALQDAYFRLARLALASHDPRQASADAEAGLALGAETDLFVANLFVARGAAREADGDPRGAAEDYHRALTMNEALLTKALPAAAPR